MALAARQVTITTSATLSVGPDLDGATVILRRSATAEVYIGPSDVTVNTGYELETEHVDIVLGPGEAVYGIVVEGAGKVYVLATQNE